MSGQGETLLWKLYLRHYFNNKILEITTKIYLVFYPVKEGKREDVVPGLTRNFLGY